MALERIPGRVRPPLAPIEPAFDPRVLRLVYRMLPLLLRVRLFPWLPAGISAVEVVGGDRLALAYGRFAAGQLRLILAFRHCEVDDPLLGLHLLARDLPRRAAALGLDLPCHPHAHFLFDRGMTLWGGELLGWTLARLGGVAVHRGRHPDWRALRLARRLVLEGRFPFALAPEGATNGHGEVVGALEPGTAQLGLWCLEDLKRAGRPEQVAILPVAVQYRYERPDWRRLGRLLTQLEKALGLPRSPRGEASRRLGRVGDAFLGELERFYALPPLGGAAPSGRTALRQRRLERLRLHALAQAEARLAVTAGFAPLESRCRRLEEAAWRRIHPEDLPPRRLRSPVRRALSDWAAHEAGLAELQMRLVEGFVAVSAAYVAERPSFERHMEVTLLLFDALARLRGDRIPARPRIGARRARVTVAEPLCIDERWAAQAHRLGSRGVALTRQAERELVAELTRDLRASFEAALI
jgi:1-acyl-sn-glycerol-3-phosphate acyltransferase